MVLNCGRGLVLVSCGRVNIPEEYATEHNDIIPGLHN